MLVENRNKFRVHPLREERVVLKFRSDLLYINVVDIVPKHNAVRIADRNAGYAVLFVSDRHISGNDLFALKCYRDLAWAEYCLAHINPEGINLAVRGVCLELLDAAEGLDRDLVLFSVIHHAVVIEELAHTTDTVAAHLAL